MGQRLVRQVCGSCRTAYEPRPDILREFFAVPPVGLKFFKGAGCARCNSTGYRGRVTVAELWTPSDHDMLLISKNAPIEAIRESARASTLSMADAAWLRLQEGRTNPEELIRVLPYDVVHEFRRTHGATGHLEALEDLAVAL